MAKRVFPKAILVEYTLNPCSVIAKAARTCYSSFNEEEDESKDSALIDMLRKNGHMSPFEHVAFTFELSGISRACSHQLVRHRIASFSQRSQRYVSDSNLEYYLPKCFDDVVINCLLCDTDGYYLEGERKASDVVAEIIEEIEEGYRKLQNAFKLSPAISDKLANENARYILPNATATSMICTMNARELIHFFSVRLCNKSQQEIRDVANMMLDEVKIVAPNLFRGVGPKCVSTGVCSEDKSCGKLNCMMKRYGTQK